MSTRKRTPSPSPTITLDVPSNRRNLHRSSSEESIRVIHQAVLFPGSPNPGRVTYVRTTYESDAELIRRQQAAIALQPLTFAEELAAKRKNLALRAEKRKLEKTAATVGKEKGKIQVPEITVVPSSGKSSPLPEPPSPTRAKMRAPLKEKAKSPAKHAAVGSTTLHGNRQQRTKPTPPPVQTDNRHNSWKKKANESEVTTPNGVFGKMDK